MSLFTRNHENEVHSFLLKLMNTNCPGLVGMREGQRGETRVNLSVPVAIVPVQHKKLLVDQAFTAMTKEFSSAGVAVVLDTPKHLEEVVVGFHLDGQISFLRGACKHLSPIGGGFFQLGIKFASVARPSDHPELRNLVF